MLIRPDGIAASRSSIWPRDHLCPERDRAPLEGDDAERILTNID
jgi:hypothetical protein